MALFTPTFSTASSTNALAQETNLFVIQADQLIMSARPQAFPPEQQADSLLRSGTISPYSNIQFNQPPFQRALPVGEKYQFTGVFPSNASNFLNSGTPQQQQPRG